MQHPILCGIALSLASGLGSVSVVLAVQPQFKSFPNIEYKNVEGKSIALDLYLDPKLTWRRPLVIYIHGGGWLGRNKLDGLPYADAFLKRGYVFASLDYRLSSQALFPAQIEDVKAAVRFLRAHSAKYRIDPDHIGVMGHSAGGHLAALLGTTNDDTEFDFGKNLSVANTVQAVCDLSGWKHRASGESGCGGRALTNRRSILPLGSAENRPLSLAIPRKLWQVGTLTYTKAGLTILFCWLLWGDFASSMKDRTVGPVLGLLFHEYHASDLVTGIFFTSLSAGIGMVLGPIISFRSDRHRGRWGRRIPFLLIPTPFAVLGMVGLAYSPVIGAHLHDLWGANPPDRDTLIILSLGIFWILFELASVAVGTVYTALINDVVPQAVMGRFYGMFRVLSLISGALFNYSIFGKADTDYIGIFLAMGILFGIGFTLMCLNVKEGEYPAVPPMDRGATSMAFSKARRLISGSASVSPITDGTLLSMRSRPSSPPRSACSLFIFPRVQKSI